MNKHFIAAASAAALSLALASGAQAAVGHIEATYSDISDLDTNSYALSGSDVLPVGSLNLQFDASVGGTHVKGAGTSKGASGAAHLFMRNDNFAVGGVVGAADEGLYAYGLEGAAYIDRVTLSAQVVGLRDESSGGVGNLGTAVALAGKVFATDDLSFGANYTTVNPKGPGGSVNVWGLDAEYKFASAPISVFAGYLRNDDFKVSGWSIGARFHFGAGSLKEQDRKGASMGNALSALSLF